MKILNKRNRKRNLHLFLILSLLIVLSIAIILVAQQARADERVYSVKISTVNGAWPPPALIPNPVELTGNFSAWPGAGLEKEHGIQIGWGDSSPYTVWRWSDTNNSWPYLTWNPLNENAKNFTGTYNTNPGDGYPNLGHNYTTGGNYTITVKFFHGQPPGAESADATVSITQYVIVPEISVSKTGPTYAHEGDLITYNITVSNPSNSTTMYKVSVIDSLLGDKSASFSASLAPLASESKTYTYTVPTPSGNITNTVTATYKDILNEQKTASASWTVTVLHPSIQAAKTGPLYAHEGDTITYNITVSNPSNGTMTKVSVNDSLLGDVSGRFSVSLAPLASESKNFTYTIPSPSGNITNTVTATYNDASNQTNTASASWTVTVLHPGISVSKSGPTYAHELDNITYTITVSNTGDCPLYSVSVTDTLLGPIYSNGLALGETKAFTVNYVVRTPSGDITNTVTAIGSDALGLQVSDSASWFVKVQYQITVTASPAEAIGGTFNVTYITSGTTYTNLQETTTWTEWVDSGTTVTVSNPQDPIPGPTGTRYKFDHYDPSASVTMDHSKTITLVYVVQHYLTVTTTPLGVNTPSGAGWYDSGTCASISTAQYVDIIPGSSRYRFNGWTTTDMSEITDPSSTSTTVLMDKAKTVTASYVTQYNITFDQTGVGSDFTGTVVTIDSSDYGVSGLPVSFWWDENSVHTFSFASPLPVNAIKKYVWSSTSGLSTLQNDPLTVTASGSVTGNYILQNAITFDQVGVSSDFTGTVVVIDGTPYGVTALPVSFYWPMGSTHSFAFQSPLIVTANTKQYVWTSTNGLSSVQSGSITVTTYGSIVGNYKTQYYLTVNNGGHGTASGQGWYDLGDTAAFSISPTTVYDGAEKRYVFTQWSGDSSSTNPSDTILMNESKTVTANWKTQYIITFGQTGLDTSVTGTVATINGSAKTYANPLSSEWIDENDQVIYSYETTVLSSETGKRFRLDNITGPASPITVTEPVTVTGNYIIQYNIIFDQTGVGSDFTGNVTTIDGTDYGIGNLSASFWWDKDSTHTFAFQSPLTVTANAKQYVWNGTSGLSSSQSDTITVSTSGNITGNYKTQYYITVTSAHDSPTASAWVDQGTDFAASVTSPADDNDLGTRYRCTGYTLDSDPPVTDGSTSYTFNDVQSAHVITFNWIAQYRLIVSSDHDAPSPSGSDNWYDTGTPISASVTSPADQVGGTRYRCTGHAGTGSAPSGATISVSFTITEPSTLTWNWIAQYYLDVISEYDSPTGEGWYDSGSTASSSVTSPVIGGTGIQCVTTGFTGTGSAPISGSGTFISFTITSPSSITWNWKTQYLVTFNQTGLDGSAIGTVVTVNGSAKNYGDLPLSMWVDNGSGVAYSYEEYISSNVSGKQYRLESVTGPASPITVTEATTVTGSYVTQYLLTFTQTGLDSTATSTILTVNGVTKEFNDLPFTVWVDSGDSITYSYSGTVSSSISGKRFILVNVTGPDSPVNVTEIFTVTGNYKTQYYLTMSTNLGTVSPSSGWYDAGSTIQISASAPSVVEGKGYAWYEWAGTGTISYSGLDNPANITLNSPITETAHWKILPEVTISVSEETIERCDRIVVQGRTLPVSSSTEVTITYTFPNGTQITHTVQTDDEGRYNDTLPLAGESLYGLFDQGGQWVISANRAGDINHEAATGSTTLGIAAPGLYQIPPVAVALLIVIVVAASYMIIEKRINGKKKLDYKTWWRATVILGLTSLAFGAASLALNWMSVAGTANTNGQTYLVNINLHPFNPGSVSITGLQYIGFEIPSLISSAWLSIPKSPGPVIALYLAPVGCILALASLYKPRTERQRRIKALTLVIAGALILIPVAQSFIFMQIQASITAGASTGYGIGLYIAMISGLLAILSSLFATRETPTGMKRASAS